MNDETRLYALEKQVERLSALENGPDLGQLIGHYMGLPELRGFWPFSSINESGNAIDLSGQGRTLTNNGTIGRGASTWSDLIYFTQNGSTQYWSRASEPGLIITGPLTFTCWFASSSVDAVARNLIAKEGYQSYLYNGYLSWWCSNGTQTGYVGSAPVADGKWHFMCGRYTPSTNVKLTVDGYTNISTATIPASLSSGTNAFSTGSNFNGSGALYAIYAAALTDQAVAKIYRLSRQFIGV